MQNILPTQPREINRTIKEKIFIISFCWFLMIFVYQNIIYEFVMNLKERGILDLHEDVLAYGLFWGSKIFPNILKIVIDMILGLLGGATVGYLLTKVRITFKSLYAFLSVIIHKFLFVGIFILIFFMTGAIQREFEGVGGLLFYFLENTKTSPVYTTFLVSSLIITFLSYYYGVNIGMKFREEGYLTTDTENRNTFLDVKWYQWLWFWIPVGIYLRIILTIIFNTIHNIILAIKHWGIWNLFTKTNGRAAENIPSAGGSFFWGIVLILVFFYQLKLIWLIITGKKKFKNKFISFSIIFFFSFVSPFLIIFIIYWLFNGK